MKMLWLLFLALAAGPCFAASNISFKKADLKPACAPNGSPATALTLATAAADFPRFTVTGWNTEFVGQTPGTYLITEGGKEHFATFCPTDGNCEPVKKMNVKIKMNKSGTGTAEYEFTNKAGEKSGGTLPVRFAVGESVACG